MDANAIKMLPMPATYGRHLAREFPVDRLLAGTGLSPADLDHADRRVAVWQAIRYAQNADEMAQEPDWYLAWAGRLSDHFHGPVSVALLSAPTLGDGLQVFLRYFPERIPYMHMEGRGDGARYAATLCPLMNCGGLTALLVEVPLLILHQYFAAVYPLDFAQAHIELAYPAPPHADRYGRYFRCPVRFGQLRHAMVIPRTWLKAPNLGYSAATWDHALSQCSRIMGSAPERNTLGELRAHLSTAFELRDGGRALPTLAESAAHLHLSSRTLIRRLRHLGTSYHQLTDEFLQSRASELLSNDQLKLKEVAGALGFGDPANFGKAFRRWYGVSPGAYRKRRPEKRGPGTGDPGPGF